MAVKNIDLAKAVVCGAVLTMCMTAAHALDRSDIPILTYHSWRHPPGTADCTYANNSLLALSQDLVTLHARGWTVIPAFWAAQWVTQDLGSASLPAKVVAITLDDGPGEDWDTTSPCGDPPARQILLDFKQRHPELPYYSPHASLFVIASPVMRSKLGLRDGWWAAAQGSGIMEVYNHSLDHDHSVLSDPAGAWDPNFNTTLSVGGAGVVDANGNPDWRGRDDFAHRINTVDQARLEVSAAASYIAGKIGVWPDLFAYPFGPPSAYVRDTYFPWYWNEHQTYAAFCGDQRIAATQSSPRFCIPRVVHGDAWNSTCEFVTNVLKEPPC